MRYVLPLLFVVILFQAATAGTIFYGPTPYLSAADSPFDRSGLGTTFWLEDFEDGELNTPGVWSPGLEFHRSSIRVSDSVDADDGVIDGFGRGYALRSFNQLCAAFDCYGSVYFEFDTSMLGQYPNFVGIVATDGPFPNSRVGFVAFGPGGEELGWVSIDPFGGPGTDQQTEEDRFVGVSSDKGISAIVITESPGGSLVVDHLQYGFMVPEPSGLSCLAVGVSLCVSRLAFARKKGVQNAALHHPR